MLFKNGVAWNELRDNPNAIKTLLEKHGIKRFPVSLAYLSTLYHKTRDGKKTVSAPSVPVPLQASVKGKTGTDVWVYCETADPGDRSIPGMPIVDYKPRRLYVSHEIVIKENQPDLLYFLLECSPLVKGGSNASDASGHYLYIKNSGKEATEKANNRRKEAQVYEFLFMPATKLSEKRLRDIAKMLFISGVEDMLSEDEVCIAIDEKIKTDKKAREKFLEYAEDKRSQSSNVRSYVQEAVDARLIMYVGGKKAWYYTDSDNRGKPALELVKIRASAKEPQEELAAHLAANEGDFAYLVKQIKDHAYEKVEDDIKAAEQV